MSTVFICDPILPIGSVKTTMSRVLVNQLVTGHDPSLKVILKLDLFLLIIISNESAIGSLLGRALSELGVGASDISAIHRSVYASGSS